MPPHNDVTWLRRLDILYIGFWRVAHRQNPASAMSFSDNDFELLFYFPCCLLGNFIFSLSWLAPCCHGALLSNAKLGLHSVARLRGYQTIYPGIRGYQIPGWGLLFLYLVSSLTPLIDMPTAESPSPSSYYTLWMCPHHPRPHFTHRVQNLTSKTRFSKETFITVGLYMISRFFWCVIFEVWIKGSPEMQLLISRSFKHYFQYEIDGINYQYVCSLSTWTEVCHTKQT